MCDVRGIHITQTMPENQEFHVYSSDKTFSFQLNLSSSIFMDSNISNGPALKNSTSDWLWFWSTFKKHGM